MRLFFFPAFCPRRFSAYFFISLASIATQCCVSSCDHPHSWPNRGLLLLAIASPVCCDSSSRRRRGGQVQLYVHGRNGCFTQGPRRLSLSPDKPPVASTADSQSQYVNFRPLDRYAVGRRLMLAASTSWTARRRHPLPPPAVAGGGATPRPSRSRVAVLSSLSRLALAPAVCCSLADSAVAASCGHRNRKLPAKKAQTQTRQEQQTHGSSRTRRRGEERRRAQRI
jgi:hypothetical protein